MQQQLKCWLQLVIYISAHPPEQASCSASFSFGSCLASSEAMPRTKRINSSHQVSIPGYSATMEAHETSSVGSNRAAADSFS